MASFDYDVVTIGSGFGGSVAAAKDYRVGVLESGRRRKDERRHPFLFPAARRPGTVTRGLA